MGSTFFRSSHGVVWLKRVHNNICHAFREISFVRQCEIDHFEGHMPILE